MEIQYVYQKKRSEFGRQCLFSDKGPDLLDNFPSNRKLFHEYIVRDPVDNGMQCGKIFSQHEVNTIRAEYTNGGMNHTEGGWPKDVNIADEDQTKRYRRKIEKEDNYGPILMQLCKNMENVILQNNAMNIYQQYYEDVAPTPLVESCTARTVNVYQDQCEITRPITHMSWSPDNGTKLAVSYCNLKFQTDLSREKTNIYIWEVENPTRPLYTLQPPSPTACLEYHQKDPNFLVSGQHNGLVACWDIRRGNEPVDYSVIEQSHRDPVNSVLWINSKSGAEFFSASTDGQCKWWDTRKLVEPLETLILDQVRPNAQTMAKALGSSCLEYDPSVPTKFMVGTEHGIILNCNRKGKTPIEKIVTKFYGHLGPVLSLQRNPSFVKNFLTVGDWSAKIWSEDCKESPIMWTHYHKPMLTDSCWSATRYSVYFTTRIDGVMDVWDILQTQQQPTLVVKVCDDVIRSIRAHEMGRLIAVGTQTGTTYLVEVSENLSICNKNDRALLTAMFDREGRREKILEARNREIKLKLQLQTKSTMNIKEDEEEEAEVEAPPPKTDEEEEKVDLGELFLKDPAIILATEEFEQVIDFETRGPDPEPEPEEEVIEEPPEPPPPPPPKPAPSVIDSPKKGKGKKDKKDKKGKK